MYVSQHGSTDSLFTPGFYERSSKEWSIRRFIAAADGRVECVDVLEEEDGRIPHLEIEYLAGDL